MEKPVANNEPLFTIDVFQIIKALWKRAWLLVLCGLVAGAAGFLYASYSIAPTYSSSVKLYVNVQSVSIAGTKFDVSTGNLSTARTLVSTYGEILNSRSTLERVIEKAGLNYSWQHLSGMISYGPSNNTEIMRVTVVAGDPYEASNIANTIAEVLPARTAEIIDGTSMAVVDSAVPNLGKLGPNITRYTAIGFFFGALACAAIIAVFVILDDTIHDEDYILQNYKYPVLGKIPDLLNAGSSKSYNYNYYYRKKHKADK